MVMGAAWGQDYTLKIALLYCPGLRTFKQGTSSGRETRLHFIPENALRILPEAQKALKSNCTSIWSEQSKPHSGTRLDHEWSQWPRKEKMFNCNLRSGCQHLGKLNFSDLSLVTSSSLRKTSLLPGEGRRKTHIFCNQSSDLEE